MKYRALFSLVITLPLLVHAQISGDFKYVGYSAGFDGWLTNGFSSVTKEISVEYSDVTLSTTNTYSGTFSSWELRRTLSDYALTTNEVLYYSSFSTILTNTLDSGSGGLNVGSNLVLTVSDEDEGFPFFFSTDTNIAISIDNIAHEDDENDDSVGFGILMRKGSGMSAASLNGTYVHYTLGNTIYGIAPYGTGMNERISLDTGMMTFNGVNLYTNIGNEYVADRQITDSLSSSGGVTVVDSVFAITNETTTPVTNNNLYAVNPDGTLLLATDDGPINLQISADASVVAGSFGMSDGDFAANFITMAVKQPTNLNVNSVPGVYMLAEFDQCYEGSPSPRDNGVEVSRTYIFLETNNTFSIRSDTWETRNTIYNYHVDVNASPPPNIASLNGFSTQTFDRDIEFESGTYSVSNNGIVTLNFGEGESGQAQVSETGEFFIFAFTESNDGDGISHLLGVGIRRTAPPPIPSLVMISNNVAMTSTGLVVTASGPSNYAIEGLASSDLTEGEWRSTGIHSNLNGTLEIFDPAATNENTTFYSTTFVPW